MTLFSAFIQTVKQESRGGIFMWGIMAGAILVAVPAFLVMFYCVKSL